MSPLTSNCAMVWTLGADRALARSKVKKMNLIMSLNKITIRVEFYNK